MQTNSYLAGKTLLVTGGKGSLGSAFIELAVAGNASRVFSIDSAYPGPETLQCGNTEISQLPADVTNLEQLAQVNEFIGDTAIDQLLLTAGIRRHQDAAELRRINIEGTIAAYSSFQHLLQSDADVVFVSSQQVLNPDSLSDPYFSSKWEIARFGYSCQCPRGRTHLIALLGPINNEFWAAGRSAENIAAVAADPEIGIYEPLEAATEVQNVLSDTAKTPGRYFASMLKNSGVLYPSPLLLNLGPGSATKGY